MKPYDDNEYLRWQKKFSKMINDYLNVEGNTERDLDDEFENAKENAEVDEDD